MCRELPNVCERLTDVIRYRMVVDCPITQNKNKSNISHLILNKCHDWLTSKEQYFSYVLLGPFLIHDWFVTRLTRRVSLVKLTLLEHLSSPALFSEVRVTRSLVLCVCFEDHCLSFCRFSFGHCVVCPSSICGFWLPLWYLQILVTSVVLGLWLGISDNYSSSSIPLNLFCVGCHYWDCLYMTPAIMVFKPTDSTFLASGHLAGSIYWPC